MIKKLSVKNFRLLRRAEVEFVPGVPIVLIGPNSSGKSTWIEVVNFLSTAVGQGLEKAGFRDRQGPSDFFTADAEGPLEIEIVLSGEEGFPNALDGGDVSYRCCIAGVGGYLQVQTEEIGIFKRGPEEKPLQVLKRTGASCRLLNRDSKDWDEVPVDQNELALASIEQEGRYPTLSNVRKSLKKNSAYPGFLTTPTWAKDPREGSASPRESTQLIPVERLDRRGLDLINTLYSLQNLYPRKWDELLHHFVQEFPFVDRLSFPPDPGGSRLALGWTDRRFPGTPLRAHQMSAGMLHFLSLLAATLPPSPPVLLAFDEPEVHLHPSALRRWVHVLEKASEKTSVLVVTHSSQLLEFLDRPVESVVTCSSGPEGIELSRLDQKSLDAWLEDFSLTQLRERGFVDASNDQMFEHS